MNHISKDQGNHLAEINRLLSVYQVLSFSQLEKTFPDLTEDKLLLLLRKLEKGGRLIYEQDTGLVRYSTECTANTSTMVAYWILLDFISDTIYHTISDFPVSLTFYTNSNYYDVIHVPEEKEILINHALSDYDEDAPKRLVVVDHTGQIPNLHFPGIAAFCTVSADGRVQYYKKQGVTDE